MTAAAAAAPMIGVTVYGCRADEAAMFEAAAPAFGVVPTLIEAGPTDANAGLVAGNRCISISHLDRLTPSTLRALRDAGVTYVGTRSVGLDHVDVARAADLGITVEHVAYSPDSVADYTLMLVLMLLRHGRSTVLRSEVHDYRLPLVRGRELRDLTVGVVGTGRIGAAVVDRLAGFGCDVLTHDRRPGTAPANVALDDLLRRSDVVTLHTPLTPGAAHLLDERRIALMRRGAYLVNTARGPLVDTAALADALERGRLGGAALDVVEGEGRVFARDHRDRPPEHDLLLRLHRMPNVVISPHTAHFTDHSLRDLVEGSLRNCLTFERSRRHA